MGLLLHKELFRAEPSQAHDTMAEMEEEKGGAMSRYD